MPGHTTTQSEATPLENYVANASTPAIVRVLIEADAGQYESGEKRARIQLPRPLWGAGSLSDYAPYFVAARDWIPIDRESALTAIADEYASDYPANMNAGAPL